MSLERIKRIEDTRKTLVEVINNSNLTAYDLLPVVEDILVELRQLANQEIKNAYEQREVEPAAEVVEE